ncbi:MAG: ETC complex I subunit [Phyllobacteriaceae bacterium]|nr:ETC complex I subunit [Phyllobacteriaceae bacterium]
MLARIYSPARTSMQSGKGKTGNWVLEYVPLKPKSIDPLMGYTSSSDVLSQVRLTFDSMEAAVAFADRKGIAYHVEQPKAPTVKRVSYSDNFSYARKQPWTH